MTRLDVYIYGNEAKTKLVAKYQSTSAHPLAGEAQMNPSPKHVDGYQIEATEGLPFDCEVIGILNDSKFPAHLGLSIGIDELARWDQQHQALHFELVSV